MAKQLRIEQIRIPFIEKVKIKINAIPHLEVRNSYTDALIESITVDYDDFKSCASPTSLKADYGIDISTLLKIGICIDKNKCLTFLKEVGFEISLPMIRKKINEAGYQELFGRKISKIGTTHILTYAEVLILVNHKIVI